MFPPDLPPVSNKLLYAWRVFAKWLSFFIFGLISLIGGILVFPIMRIFIHPKIKFQKYGRRATTLFFKVFISIMRFLGIVNLEPDNRENYRRLSSKIIVANHPSLLDVVMLISLIPNADCIVSSNLRNNILSAVVRQLYILNSRELDDILNACTETLKQGNCLIIFPEGTRTPRTGRNILRKGSARIALASGCNIVPVQIGGTDKFGLGKKDPWPGFNPREKYIYRLTMKDEINPEKYKDIPAAAAAKQLTDEIETSLFQNKK